MVRYAELQDFLSKLKISEIDALIPFKDEHRKIENLLEKLYDLSSVKKSLLSEGLYLANVRALFDVAIDFLSARKHHRIANTDIV